MSIWEKNYGKGEYKCQKLAEIMQKAPKVSERLDAVRRSLQPRGLVPT